MKTALVTGSSGFIGHHLVRYLKARGYHVRGVDIVPPVYDSGIPDAFLQLDLRQFDNALAAVYGMDDVYQLAADIGGLGYIHDGNHAHIMRNNALINLNMIEAARMMDVQRYLYTSSAVVYPEYLQDRPDSTALHEDDVHPYDPAEGGYGFEKLFSERLCAYYHAEYGLDVRVARLHNSYGPEGTYDGGKEKAPAAICRKVAVAKLMEDHEIEVWGDGEQTRSFTYIDDTVEGLYRLMQSGYTEPVNIGSSELVTINEMTDLVASIAGIRIHKVHDLSKPQGVRGRNSSNALIREVLGWEPSTPLAEGLKPTYAWVEAQIAQAARVAA